MSDVRDKSPWYGTAEDGLCWILRDETCKTEQIELVAEKALEKIEALLSLSADKDREIESLQRKNERFRESIEKAGVEVFEQIDHKAPTHWLLARIVSRAKQPSITPEMREILKRAFALAREIEDRELAEDLCGLLIRTDPKQARLNTGGEG